MSGPDLPLPAPGDSGRRIEIDALRGAALAVVAVVNLPHFLLPIPFIYGAYLWPASGSGRVGCFLVRVFLERKAWMIFATLFGFGCAAITARPIGADGRGCAGRYWRRIGGLFALGLLHGLVLSPLDILMTYAVTGAVLWFFRSLPPGRLLLAGGIGAFSLSLAKVVAVVHNPDALKDFGFAGIDPLGLDYFSRVVGDYQSGIFHLVYRRHLCDFGAYALGALPQLPAVIGFGLIGMALQRKGPGIGAAVRPGVLGGVGAATALAGGWAGLYCDPMADSVAALTFSVLTDVSGMLLAGAYALIILDFAARRRRHWLILRLAAVGRLSLTNYITQSAVAAALILSGLYGRLGFWPMLGIGIAVYGAQFAASGAILRASGRGVFERLVRA